MALIPKAVRFWHLIRQVMETTLKLTNEGKVRLTFSLPNYPHLLLVIVSDRISIFDFILTALIPKKGMVLNAMAIFWFTTVLKHIPNHLVAYGSGIDKYLPEELRGNIELQQRATVVLNLTMAKAECITRNNLAGTGWTSYKKTGQVCGHKLQPGLYDGAQLPEPIFTPTTKAEKGHDEHLSQEDVDFWFGPKLGKRTLEVNSILSNYCAERGIIKADGKDEYGYNEKNELILGDEVGTPDNSRFWSRQKWQEMQERPIEERKAPASYDKEFMRDWGKTIETPFVDEDGKKIVGINNLKPEIDEHVTFVHSLGVDTDVLLKTSEIYLDIFKILTGQTLEEFQRDVMGIR